MGHRVPNHKSKCKNLHGHRYKIEVGVDDKVISTKGASDEGMVIDFSDLKQIMMEQIDAKFDHGFVMSNEDIFKATFNVLKFDHGQKIIFVDFIPTAENLANHWYSIMKEALVSKKIRLIYVKVWETPSSTAVYGIYDESTAVYSIYNEGDECDACR